MQIMSTTWVCIAKDQDIRSNAIVSQFNGFINGCHRKHPDVMFFKTGGNCIYIMTIGICLDDSHDIGVWMHDLFQLMNIMNKCCGICFYAVPASIIFHLRMVYVEVMI